MVSQNEYPFDEGDTGADGRSIETSISIALVVLDEDGCLWEQLWFTKEKMEYNNLNCIKQINGKCIWHHALTGA